MSEPQRIARLPADVVGRIAAGEMIARPSAALKELIENALDAEATRIGVAVRGGLDQYLQVSDDGVGIPAAELALALERYATSKIRTEEDLLRIETLGFRGEALAAIAEISRLTLISRTRDAEHAWSVRAEAGRIGVPEAAARAPGTTVIVEDLFFNAPVRKRFLKTDAAETRLARGTLVAHALAAPGIGWTFEQDGRNVLDFPPAPDLRARLVQIQGRRTGEGLLELDWHEGPITLRGFVGVPELARAGRSHQTFFVNGRWVVSPWLGQAVRQGYGDLLPGHHNPWVVLFIRLPPDRVDVNLHPTKREVRFLDEPTIFACVQRGVRHAVAQLLPRFFLDAARPGPADGGERGPDAPRRWGAMERADATHAPGGELFDGLEAASRLYQVPPGAAALAADLPGGVAGAPPSAEAFDQASEVRASLAADAERAESVADAGGLVSLWQLHGTYVLAQTRKGLLIIDQHAAHERILYEQILDRLASDSGGAQQLLFPVIQELTAEEADLFQELRGSLVRMGFDVEEFGERTVLVRGIPPLWHVRGEARLVRDLLDEVAELGLREGEIREGLARAFACRAAIKAGMPLSVEEMNRLVDELFATRVPHGDPHGRPTFVFVSLQELNRRFGRSARE